MSLSVCPFCGAQLFPSELRERRCNSCSEPLPSPVQAEPSPVQAEPPSPLPPRREARLDDDEDYSRRREVRRRGGSGWAPVRTGLGLIIACVIVYLLALLCGFMGAAGRMGPEPMLLVGLAVCTAALLGLIGLCLCVAVPVESGLRGLAIGFLMCLLLCIGMLVLLVLVAGFALVPRGPANLEPLFLVAGCGAALLGLAGSLLFFLFLRGVAYYFGARHLGDECITYYVVSILFGIGTTVVRVFLEGGRGMGGAGLGLAVGCGMLLFSLVLVLWYISLLTRVRDVIPATS